MVYDQGDEVLLEAVITDHSGVRVNTTVLVTVKDPAGARTTPTVSHPASVTASATSAVGSKTLTLASTAGILQGMLVVSVNVPEGTEVAEVKSATVLILDTAATLAGAVSTLFDGTGMYSAVVAPNIAGTWRYRFEATGAYVSAGEQRFDVSQSGVL